MITYAATLDIPRPVVDHLARLLAAHRRRIGTPKGSRALGCFRQAVLVLRWFPERGCAHCLARDAGICQATGYRYLHEGIDVLAERAPDLHEVLRRCHDEGIGHVILDGTLSPVIGSPGSAPPATTCDTPGNTTCSAATSRFWPLPTAPHCGSPRSSLARSTTWPPPAPTLCPPCTGPPPSCTCPPGRRRLPRRRSRRPHPGHQTRRPPLPRPHPDNRTYNQLLRGLRALGERAAAELTQRWHTPGHITLSPSRIGNIARAAVVLNNSWK